MVLKFRVSGVRGMPTSGSGSDAGSYLRLMDSFITQLEA